MILKRRFLPIDFIPWASFIFENKYDFKSTWYLIVSDKGEAYVLKVNDAEITCKPAGFNVPTDSFCAERLENNDKIVFKGKEQQVLIIQDENTVLKGIVFNYENESKTDEVIFNPFSVCGTYGSPFESIRLALLAISYTGYKDGSGSNAYSGE